MGARAGRRARSGIGVTWDQAAFEAKCEARRRELGISVPGENPKRLQLLVGEVERPFEGPDDPLHRHVRRSESATGFGDRPLEIQRALLHGAHGVLEGVARGVSRWCGCHGPTLGRSPWQAR